MSWQRVSLSTLAYKYIFSCLSESVDTPSSMIVNLPELVMFDVHYFCRMCVVVIVVDTECCMYG